MGEIDNIRIALDEALSAVRKGLDLTAGPVMLRELRTANDRIIWAQSALNVLAERQGPGGESASSISPMDSPSPLVTCDGVKKCAMSDKAIKECPHSKPHKRMPLCTNTERCSSCPPPLGVCR